MSTTDEVLPDQKKGGATKPQTKPKETAPKTPKAPVPEHAPVLRTGRVRTGPAAIGVGAIAAAIASVQIAAAAGPTAGVTAAGVFAILVVASWFAYKAWRRGVRRRDGDTTSRGARRRAKRETEQALDRALREALGLPSRGARRRGGLAAAVDRHNHGHRGGGARTFGRPGGRGLTSLLPLGGKGGSRKIAGLGGRTTSAAGMGGTSRTKRPGKHGSGVSRTVSALGRGVGATIGAVGALRRRSNPDPSVTTAGRNQPRGYLPRPAGYTVRYSDGTTSGDGTTRRQRATAIAREKAKEAKTALKAPLEGMPTRDEIRQKWGRRMVQRWEQRETDRLKDKGYQVKYRRPNQIDTPSIVRKWKEAERADITPQQLLRFTKPGTGRNAVPRHRGPAKPIPKLTFARDPKKWKGTTPEQRKLPRVHVPFFSSTGGSEMSIFDSFSAEDATPEQVEQLLQKTPDELRSVARSLASIAQNAAGTAYRGLDEGMFAVAQGIYAAAARAEEAGAEFVTSNAVAKEFREQYSHLPGAENWANPS